jgi:hypothetical protein
MTRKTAEITLPADGPRSRKVASVAAPDGRVQKIRGRLLQALTLMIWGEPETGRPLDWNKAAEQVGLRVRTMRLAMQKPHVRQFMAAERKHCREVIAAANPMVAKEIRDASDGNQMARLGALRWIEGDDADRVATSGRMVVPGTVVVIKNEIHPAPGVDFETLIEVDPSHDDEARAS